MSVGSILAVARRDLIRVYAGDGGRRALRMALVMVVSVAAVPCGATPYPAPLAATLGVSGQPPESVLEVAQWRADAPIRVDAGRPIRVSGRRVPPTLRAALDRGSQGPTVRVRRTRPRPLRPGRNLWVVLLAASLLTGPLVESLPGERSQGTWETLRAAPVSALALLTGKWLAWTSAATLVACMGIGVGIASGVQTVAPALAGVPLALGSIVALGLWLLRSVEDPSGAATIPIRVIPVVLLAGGAVSMGIAPKASVLAAAVPFGGPLWLVAGEGVTWSQVLAAATGTTLCVLSLLMHGAGSVDRRRRPPREGLESLAVACLAVLVGWSGGLVPSLLSADGETLTRVENGRLVAGLGWMLLLAVGMLRQNKPVAHERLGLPVRGLLEAAMTGMVLASAKSLLPRLSDFGGQAASFVGTAADGSAVVVLLISVVGQELLFRGPLAARMHPAWSIGAWVIAAQPAHPIYGSCGGVLLWWLAQRRGVVACILAHLLASVLTAGFAVDA